MVRRIEVSTEICQQSCVMVHSRLKINLLKYQCVCVSVGNPAAKRPLGRHGHRWTNNFVLDFNPTEWDNVDRINLTQDRNKMLSTVNVVLKIRFPQYSRNFISRETASFWREISAPLSYEPKNNINYFSFIPINIILSKWHEYRSNSFNNYEKITTQNYIQE